MVAAPRARSGDSRIGVRSSPVRARPARGHGGGAVSAPVTRVSRRLDHRKDALWIAALVHRLSGLALAIFLPLHFLALGLAIDGEAKLDSFLRWTDQPLVKVSEGGLI